MKKGKKEKPKYNVWQNVWFMIKLAWRAKEKKVPLLCILTALLAVGINLVNLYLAPTILSAVERRATIGELVLTIGLFVGASMLLGSASAYVSENTMWGRVTLRTYIIKLNNHKALTTSYPNLDDEKFSGLLDKVCESTSNNDAAAEAVWSAMTSLLENVLGLIFYMGLLSLVQPMLIAVVLVTAAGAYFCGNYADQYLYRHRKEETEPLGRRWYLIGTAGDMGAAKDLRIFDGIVWLRELRCKARQAYRAYCLKIQNVYLVAKVGDILLTFLREGVAYGYLILLVLGGKLTVSEFLLYFTAVSGFAGWVTGLLEQMRTLNRYSISLSSIREFLEYPEPFLFKEGMALDTEPDRVREIRLEGVFFRYPGAEEDTIRGLDLTLHPGEKLAVVGLNGAGKTTLVKLLCGFLDPTEGRVLLDGKDIRGYNRENYYQLFSAVFQDFSIMAGSVAMNVAQEEENIDYERVWNCLKMAGMEKKVADLPKGCETLLNREVYDEATVFSGGETQRLILARALYKDAAFVVLDEPTAALDPIAESELYEKYNEMTAEKSAVYISHRLASTRFCDRIILLENGHIAEEGTHESLLAAGGKYAELFAVQSRYYQEGGQADEEA